MQALQGCGLAAIIEAQTIDERTVLRQTKHARASISGLRQGRERAYLGKTETDAMDTGNGCAVFVKTRRHAERIGEIKPHNMLRQNRFILRRRTEAAQQVKPAQGQPMRRLGRQGEEHGAQEAVKAHAAAPSKKALRPSRAAFSINREPTISSLSGP